MLQADHAIVVERRNLPVLARRQSLEPGLAGVHDEGAAAGVGDAADEPVEVGLGILVVDADPALHRDRHANPRLHGSDTVRHQSRLRHQAGAEPAFLHPIRRAADIEIDLVIAEALADRGSLGEPRRIGPA